MLGMIWVGVMVLGLALYGCQLLWARGGLRTKNHKPDYPRISSRLMKKSSLENPMVSIIIAAKNEEAFLLGTLSRVFSQTVDPRLYEVILVNDASTDGTRNIAEGFVSRGHNLSILDMGETCPFGSRKKYALQEGIAHARGSIILCTDADCLVPHTWVASYLRAYEDPRVGAVIGMVGFSESPLGTASWGLLGRLFMAIQELEFLFLGTLSLAYCGRNHGIACNGNNFSYRKVWFDRVGGFSGISHIKSGDDDLLLQKFVADGAFTIRGLGQVEATTLTAPEETLGGFMNQRSRWASKTFVYRDPLLVLLVVTVGLVSLALFLAPLVLLFEPWILPVLLVVLKVKSAIDGYFVYPSLRTLNKKGLLILMPLLVPLHALYVVVVTLRGSLGSFNWKSGLYGVSTSRVQTKATEAA